MTTVITSIGSNTSIDTETPSSCSVVSGGYEVTFSTDPTGVSVGDICTIEDQSSMYSTFTYLVTDISGSVYTLKYISDTAGHGSTSPCSMYDMSYQQSSATFKRAYSTITSWESQLDLTEYYSSSDDAVGECYNDSTFDENFTINGGGSVGLNSVKLTVPEADRHDGTEASGVTIDYTGSGTSVITVSRDNVTIEWLEFDMSSGSSNSSNNRAITIDSSATSGIYFRNNIIYDLWGSFPVAVSIGTGGDSSDTRYLTNNIIYNVDDSDDRVKAFQSSSSHPVNLWNNTTYNIRTGRSSKDAYAYYCNETTGMILKNCVGYMGSSTGSDYFSHNADSSSDYNATDESTATGGANDIVSIATSEFVSVAGGSEDLHVAVGAQCVGAGVDLGTTAGVNIDIDGFDRTTRTAWSIGAGDESKPPDPSLQYAVPDSDTSVDGFGAYGWAASTGSDLYALIDEANADDSDYARFRGSDSESGYSYYKMGLSDIDEPTDKSTLSIRVRVSNTSDYGDVRLYDGSTLIKRFNGPSNGFGTGSKRDLNFAIPEADANNITDYTDLSIWIGIDDESYGYAYIYQVWLEAGAGSGGGGGGGGGGDSESEDRKLHRNPQRAASRSISNKLSNYRERERWLRNRGLSRRHSAPEKYSSTKYSSKDKYGYNK